MLVAVSASYWTTPNPNNDPLCTGVSVQVTYNGRTITVPVRDKCRAAAAGTSTSAVRRSRSSLILLARQHPVDLEVRPVLTRRAAMRWLLRLTVLLLVASVLGVTPTAAAQAPGKGVSALDFSGVTAALADVRAGWYYTWRRTPRASRRRRAWSSSR